MAQGKQRVGQKKVIFIDDHASELVCDNPRCDYHAPPGTHTWGPHLIGVPCPKCGQSLLTQKDYDMQCRVYEIIEKVNRFFAFFGIGKTHLDADDDKVKLVSIRAVQGKIEIDPNW